MYDLLGIENPSDEQAPEEVQSEASVEEDKSDETASTQQEEKTPLEYTDAVVTKAPEENLADEDEKSK